MGAYGCRYSERIGIRGIMKKRETHKDIELSGRKWRIEKFDALTGNFISVKLMSKLAGVLVGIASGEVSDEAVIVVAISQAIGSMGKAEVIELQEDALSVCKEMTMVGSVETGIPVRTQNRSWGVADLEHDPLTVMGLVSHSLVFNVSPFFDESALKAFKESFRGLNLFSVQTSTSSSTPRS